MSKHLLSTSLLLAMLSLVMLGNCNTVHARAPAAMGQEAVPGEMTILPSIAGDMVSSSGAHVNHGGPSTCDDHPETPDCEH